MVLTAKKFPLFLCKLSSWERSIKHHPMIEITFFFSNIKVAIESTQWRHFYIQFYLWNGYRKTNINTNNICEKKPFWISNLHILFNVLHVKYFGKKFFKTKKIRSQRSIYVFLFHSFEWTLLAKYKKYKKKSMQMLCCCTVALRYNW